MASYRNIPWRTVEVIRLCKTLAEKNSLFDGRFLKSMRVEPLPHPLITKADRQLLFRVTADPTMCNLLGVLHTGALGTLLHYSTTITVMTFDKRNRVLVPAEASLSFMSSVKAGEEVLILSEIDRIGKSIAFSHVWVYSTDSKCLAHGKFMNTLTENTYEIGGKYSHPFVS